MATESAPVQTIRMYADALQQCTAEDDTAGILKVFLARDRVQACLQQPAVAPESALIWLVELDQQLQSLASEIAGHPELVRWRRSIQPSEKNWWWYATPQAEGFWHQLDWLWNAASLVCLAAFASYLTAFTAKFAVGGFDLLKSFGLIGNGTVAVLVLTSLTQSGRKILIKLLERLNVSPKYHSEVTFLASALLLVSAIALQANLPRLGQYYYTQGAQNFVERRFIPAEKQIRQSLELQPDNGDAHLILGRIYEIQEDLEAARAEYNLALQNNTVLAYNNLGRLLIADANYRQAEALLIKGLSVAQSSTPEAYETLFVLYKNLGWAQLKQLRHAPALANLEQAALINQTHLNELRNGEVDCILSAVLERLDSNAQAITAAKVCIEQATFETALDHEWFIDAQNRISRLENKPASASSGSNMPAAAGLAPGGAGGPIPSRNSTPTRAGGTR
ncbi:MAG: tetratricopeptide repeat protein [Cyanobacteria bacterium P01_D01_bin.6]